MNTNIRAKTQIRVAVAAIVVAASTLVAQASE